MVTNTTIFWKTRSNTQIKSAFPSFSLTLKQHLPENLIFLYILGYLVFNLAIFIASDITFRFIFIKIKSDKK